MRLGRTTVALATLLSLAAPAFAQSPSPPPPAAVAGAIPPAIGARASDILAIMRGQGDVAATFHPTFLAEISEEKLRAIAKQLSDQYGAPLRVMKINAADDRQATFELDYERGVAQVSLVLAGPEDGHKVTGFWITQVAPKGDSLAAIQSGFAALDGDSAFGIYSLKGTELRPLLEGGTRAPLATGSSFKLVLLAALDADIRAGRRKWSDVVPLSHKSLPSGQTQNWPDRAPMTLQSLATLMISISDNSATDTLLHLLGRERVSDFALKQDMLDSKGMPVLTTLEAFVLKEPGHKAMRERWAKARAPERLALLRSEARGWTVADAKAVMLTGTPQSIDTVEWFATPRQMANALVWFADKASPEARAILAVNPGLPDPARRGWSYIGYKGGSETGVIAANYLLINKDGRRYIVSAAWNDRSKAVDNDRFFALVNRMITLAAPK